MSITKEKLQQWLPHIIILLFVVILPMFIFDQSDSKIRFWRYRYYHQLFFMIIAFYINYLFIVPRVFFSGKRIRFFVMLFTVMVVLLGVSQILSNKFEVRRPPQNNGAPPVEKRESRLWGLHPRLYDDALSLILIFGFSTGMCVIKRLREDEKAQKDLEKTRVETELAFLKNQINPHFFFNSLNNIYALIAIDGDKAQKAIEKLAGLMRYLIYESAVETVPLTNEFEFTRNYIALMRQRLSSKVALTIDIQQDAPKVKIPPLIFIPFVENAFKHGVSYREKSFINISLRVIDEKIVFSCKNSIPATPKTSESENGGFGIANIKKRLDLLYGKAAQLRLDDKNGQFSVELVLPVKENA